MIHVSFEEKSRNWLWLPVILSVLVHAGMLLGAERLDRPIPQRYAPSRVEVRVPPPRAPKPEPIPEPPKPEPPKPKPKPKPNKVAPPKPNKVEPLPKTPPKEPPKPVFGVTEDSVSNHDSGVSVRVGNTLNKDMEKEFTEPKKVAALPAAPLKRKSTPVPIYELTETPSFLRKVEPEFPLELRKLELQGVVELEVLISEKGRPVKVRVLKTPDRRLVGLAVKALRASRFSPGKVGKKAVPVKIKIPYRFVLDR